MKMKHSVPRDPAIDAFADRYDGDIGATVRYLVDLIRATLPDTTEGIHHHMPKFCINGEICCYVAAYSAHVNLGFYEGSGLDDPEGLLTGTGKHLRHVSLTTPKSVAKGKLVKMLKQAAAMLR